MTHSFLNQKPLIMGILNVSPNSFYQPLHSIDAVLEKAEEMVRAGAEILDVGGEATNPAVDIANDVPSIEAEVNRVIPAVEAIKKNFNVRVSVDTSRAFVMRQAVNYGADMINDQRALQVGNALETVKSLNVPVCLMHFFMEKREPGSCSPRALLNQIKQALMQRVKACIDIGIDPQKIILDPGFGGGHFGKSAEENFYLLANLNEIISLGYPVLTGQSRKSMIGAALGGVPAEARLYGTIAADTIAMIKGTSIIRTHDVKAIADARAIYQAVYQKISETEEVIL